MQSIINKRQSDHYYKALKTRTHLITMLIGILSRCDSMTEICEGIRALGSKLNHLGMEKAAAKSTASDELRNRGHEFFENLYFAIVKKYQSFLSDSRTFRLTFKEVLLIARIYDFFSIMYLATSSSMARFAYIRFNRAFSSSNSLIRFS